MPTKSASHLFHVLGGDQAAAAHDGAEVVAELALVKEVADASGRNPEMPSDLRDGKIAVHAVPPWSDLVLAITATAFIP
jgi:hypothetical protein